jgi:hypothetical protein
MLVLIREWRQHAEAVENGRRKEQEEMLKSQHTLQVV